MHRMNRADSPPRVCTLSAKSISCTLITSASSGCVRRLAYWLFAGQTNSVRLFESHLSFTIPCRVKIPCLSCQPAQADLWHVTRIDLWHMTRIPVVSAERKWRFQLRGERSSESGTFPYPPTHQLPAESRLCMYVCRCEKDMVYTYI